MKQTWILKKSSPLHGKMKKITVAYYYVLHPDHVLEYTEEVIPSLWKEKTIIIV